MTMHMTSIDFFFNLQPQARIFEADAQNLHFPKSQTVGPRVYTDFYMRVPDV